MRVLLWLLSGALVAAAPGVVWAQGLRYEMLTLAEAAYLHSGLALQAVLRMSSLRQLPQVIVVCCVMWLVYRRVTSPRPQPITGIVAYVVSCTLILVLFWPEAAPRFFTVSGVTIERVTAVGITSFIPRQQRNPGLLALNAADSGLVPVNLRNAAGVPRALDLILRAATDVPLVLAQAVNPGLGRVFSRMLVMDDFVKEVELSPPASLRTRMPDFFEQCYRPAVRELLKSVPDLTFDDAPPWSAAMAAQLGSMPLASNRGVADDYGTAPASTTTTCQAFYESLENGTREYLRRQETAQGSNKRRGVREEMGINGLEQARIFVQRELERHMPGVGPTQVVHAKRTLDVAAGTASAVSQFDLTAPFKSTGTQLEKHLDRMSRLLGVGSFLVFWAPYIVGIAIFVVLAFFPVVLLWSMFPGQHFKPLINYFLLLVFVCSTPLWWAIVDAAAEVAYREPPTGDWFAAAAGWGMAYVSYIVVTVVGIIMVPVLQATLLFGSWRAIGSIWHA